MSAKEALKTEICLAAILSDYVPEDEFCRQLGISSRTAKRWQELRIGPPITKIGRKVYYSRKSVLEWLASQEQRPQRVRSERRDRSGQAGRSASHA
jgi:hypothetical protein